MAVWIPIRCIHCNSSDVVKNGKSAEGKQRYLCRNEDFPYRTFILDYSYQGCLQEVKQQVVEMTLNGSGVRDTARVLHISTDTIINELKKRPKA